MRVGNLDRRRLRKIKRDVPVERQAFQRCERALREVEPVRRNALCAREHRVPRRPAVQVDRIPAVVEDDEVEKAVAVHVRDDRARVRAECPARRAVPRERRGEEFVERVIDHRARRRVERLKVRLQRVRVGIRDGALDRAVRHERIRPVRNLLGESEPVAVRVARGVLVQIAVPVEFVAVGYAVAVRVPRGGQIVRRQRGVFVELEARRVVGPSPGVAGGEVLLGRNRPVRENGSVHRRRRGRRPRHARDLRLVAEDGRHAVNFSLLDDMHEVGPCRRGVQGHCTQRKQDSVSSLHIRQPFSE